MLQSRIIPVLLLKNGVLVKTIKFDNEIYIGDPINAVRIFNEKEVDELIILDISKSKNNETIDFDLIKQISSEAFMPVGYGGGIKSINDIEQLFKIGIEKVILNNILFSNLDLISNAAVIFGNQSIVASIDIKKNIFNKYQIYDHVKKKRLKIDINSFICELEKLGVGEIFLNSVDNDGKMTGYDIKLVKTFAPILNIPLIICGGAKDQNDILNAINSGASAAAAGSMFVFHGVHKAVLINYQKYENLSIEKDK